MLKSRYLIRLFVVLVSGFLLACNKDKQPNIIFIMSDDHASHAISCYGSQINQTLHIDRLAQEGMRFEKMMTTNAICAPSRATILTGKFNHKNGFLQNGYSFDGSQQTFPKLLQKAGYQTAIVGKWHLKSEPTGFDYYNVIPGHGRYFNCRFKKTGKMWRDGVAGGEEIEGYLTDVITDQAEKWLDKRNPDKPFFLMVHHKAPHGPHDPHPKYADLYNNKDLPETETLYDEWLSRIPASEMAGGYSKIADCNYPQYEELVKKHPQRQERTRIMYQTFMKGYLRLVASLDENIGRLLDYIDKNGLRDNTIVIYTSDNGFFLGDHGYYNKMWMYEEALKIPFIIRYPEYVKSGSVSKEMVQNIDFAPTFLDYAGVPVPGDIQGKSFRSIIEGKKVENWRDKIYYHYYTGYDIPEQYGVRTENYKLIHFPGYKEEPYYELFDLQNDPREYYNVSAHPAYANLTKQLKGELDQLREIYQETNEIRGPKNPTRSITHLGVSAPMTLKYKNSPKYTAESNYPLTDGIINNVSPRWAFYYDKWLGFEVDDVHATIDLKKTTRINTITVRFLEKLDNWIFPPEKVDIFVSQDGNTYTLLPSESMRERAEGGIAFINLYRSKQINQPVRFVRVVAKNPAVCPDWHPGAGGKAWLFVDEIIVE